MTSAPLLVLEGLRTYFAARGGVVKAVDGVSFALRQGESLGLVGESGSGKSITCTSILRLVPEPGGRIVGGRILFKGDDLLAKSSAEMRAIRGRDIAMILQDPLTSLNPAFTVGDQVAEAIALHQDVRGNELRARVFEILASVGIPAPERRARDYPHQLSGGMRQRVAGAIALSCRPSLLIADEPTTSLDATIAAQYLRLLKDLQRELRFGLIFVTHDLGLIPRICDRVAIMYAGRIVETAAVDDVFRRPAHPYAEALIEAMPALGRTQGRLSTIPGQPPVPRNLPPGCSFAPRCPKVLPRCTRDDPPSVDLGHGRVVNCWLHADAPPIRAGHA